VQCSRLCKLFSRRASDKGICLKSWYARPYERNARCRMDVAKATAAAGVCGAVTAADLRVPSNLGPGTGVANGATSGPASGSVGKNATAAGPEAPSSAEAEPPRRRLTGASFASFVPRRSLRATFSPTTSRTRESHRADVRQRLPGRIQWTTRMSCSARRGRWTACSTSAWSICSRRLALSRYRMLPSAMTASVARTTLMSVYCGRYRYAFTHLF
jgi:hypothetical protein